MQQGIVRSHDNRIRSDGMGWDACRQRFVVAVCCRWTDLPAITVRHEWHVSGVRYSSAVAIEPLSRHVWMYTLVWCGVVWCGVVWCGVCGVACDHTMRVRVTRCAIARTMSRRRDRTNRGPRATRSSRFAARTTMPRSIVRARTCRM